MAEDFKIQLSVNIPSGEQFEKGDMVNIRANDPGEFANMLQAFQAANFTTLCAEAAANIKAAYLVARDLGAQTVTHEQHAPQGPQNGAGAPNGGPQGGYAQQAPNGPQNGSQGFQGPPPGDPWGNPNQYGNQPQGYGNQPQGYGQAQGYQQGQPQGGYQQQGGQPANNGVPTSPPPHVGPAPQCSHGVKKFIAKPNKNGKGGYWMAWACPADRQDPTQHELQFISNK